MTVSELKQMLSIAPDDYAVYVDVGACYMDGVKVSIDNENQQVVIDYEHE